MPAQSPAGLTRRRLVDKLPPERPWGPTPAPATRIVECTACRIPGRPEALPGGLCHPCRTGTVTPPPRPPRLSPAQVRRRAAQARAVLHRS